MKKFRLLSVVGIGRKKNRSPLVKFLKRCLYHKWKNVYSINIYEFLGEKCSERSITNFRICKKCGKAQVFKVTHDSCGWVDLSDYETNILLGEVVNKGDYYLLDKKGGKDRE